MSLGPGSRLDAYELLQPLGAGGMGEVWLATEVRLGRKIALKLLPPDLTRDPARVSRFEQEAKAASALSHPNVCTIHALGETAEGQHYIAMEYVEGETLRRRIAAGRLNIRESLDIAIQIASALVAAHANGIVHRDIKPENVMLRPDGLVKVLDFGLAKLAAASDSAAIEATQTAFRTDAGTVVGTVAYMSPEQARAQQVDARTDIWSLGVVLYEIVAGRPPFAGSSSNDVIAGVLEHEPAPLARFDPDVPAELQRILRRALRKDRSQRYQIVQDLELDLEALRQEVAAAPRITGGETGADHIVSERANARSQSSAEYLVVQLQRHTTSAIAAALVLLALLSVALWGGVQVLRTREAGSASVARNLTPAAVGSAVPLTSYPGMEGTPSLSPDGSQVAFSWNGEAGDNFDIYVKLVGPGQPWRLTTNPARDEQPSWSPDGRFIAFNRYVTESTADLMVIPALGGGAERRLTTIEVMPTTLPLMGALAWTPDGRWVVFSGRPSEDKPYGVWLTAIDHPETRLLTANPGSPVESSDFSPALSQDGRRLAFIRVTTMSQNAVYVLPLSAELTATSPPSRVTRAHSGFLGVAWTPDGSGLLVSSGGHLGSSRLQRIALGPTRLEPSGEPELLPFGEHATAITISKTGRVVYAAQYRDSNLRKLDLSTPASGPDPSPVASSTFDEQTPDYSPDGTRLAFASTRSGVEEIWVSNADGSNPTQVTFTHGPQCSNPRWSPDGRMILFDSRREGTADLYMLDPRSLETRRITSDPTEEIEPRWSRDGRWIYFGSNRTGRYEIWKIRAEGGEAVRITRNGGLAAIESPDGRWLYYAKDFHSPSSIWRVPVGGGAETLVVHGLSYSLNFVVADRGLYFIAVGDAPQKTSLDFVDYGTGKRSTLLALGKRFWYGTALSPDQRTMLYSIVDDFGSNLMVVEGFR